jgi:hypothetical protein
MRIKGMVSRDEAKRLMGIYGDDGNHDQHHDVLCQLSDTSAELAGQGGEPSGTKSRYRRDVFAIDPGTTKSAYVIWDGESLVESGIIPNEALLPLLRREASPRNTLLIEQIRSYGMAVGAETFDTVFWSGRFAQQWEVNGGDFVQIPRIEIKVHHCKSAKAKDPNVRQALIDKYGAPGTKKNPGTTYGIASHLWAAFALATYWTETKKSE